MCCGSAYRHTPPGRTYVCVCVCVKSWECVRSLGSWQVSVDMHGHILFASECARSSAESPLSRLFSPLCHHDNLLTPAQLHTANISLPSPVTCSSSAPHPPIFSPPLIRLYFIVLPSSPVSSVSSSIFSFLHFPCRLHPPSA